MIFFKDMVILDFSYYFMCSVSRVCTLVSVGEGVPVEMSEEGMRAPRTEVADSCEPSNVYLEYNRVLCNSQDS